MAKVLFNRNPIKFGKSIKQPSIDEIKNTPALWNASLDDALKYGGELTRAVIGAMDLKFDRKYIIVDTKIHMLMPGFYPAIPGWHTDGVPRGKELKPNVKATPNIFAQEEMSDTRFHLLVTGAGCLTKFLTDPIELSVPDEPDTNLYKNITEQIHTIKPSGIVSAPSCTVVEFDWWTLHTGVKSEKHEWRFLIRVTETDHMEPQTDLRKIIRTQQQVYVPESFGW